MKQDFGYEKDFWKDCRNTLREELKQLEYAKFMGLYYDNYPMIINGLEGKRILDIGGGPSSLLLKTVGLSHAKVIDPLKYPTWVYNRYDAANVEWEIGYGEEIDESPDSFDEVWIYNVLQHTTDPEEIIYRAKIAAPVIRLFEWINLPAYPGHPQMLTKERLNKALDSIGHVDKFENTDCYFIWLQVR